MSQPVIQGSAGYTTEIIKEVIDYIENLRTPLHNIITAKFPLADFEEAMENAAVKAHKNIKVILDCE